MIMDNLYMHFQIEPQVVCTSEIVPVVFFNITCATKLHVKHLSVTCVENYTCDVINYVHLINDWSAILLHLLCIIFNKYMCGFLLFTEFWCFATRFSGCCEIWLSHRQNNIFVTKHLLAINYTTSE